MENHLGPIGHAPFGTSTYNQPRKEQANPDDVELALSYARELVDMWPNVTMRTLGTVTKKIVALREALELAKR